MHQIKVKIDLEKNTKLRFKNNHRKEKYLLQIANKT